MMKRVSTEVDPQNAPNCFVDCVVDITDVECARQSANDNSQSVLFFRSGLQLLIDTPIPKVMEWLDPKGGAS